MLLRNATARRMHDGWGRAPTSRLPVTGDSGARSGRTEVPAELAENSMGGPAQTIQLGESQRTQVGQTLCATQPYAHQVETFEAQD